PCALSPLPLHDALPISAGMHWSRLPLFVWTVYATSIIIVLATPVLGVTLLLVAADHALGLGMFDPAHGGDPILFQHLFWFYSHPDRKSTRLNSSHVKIS